MKKYGGIVFPVLFGLLVAISVLAVGRVSKIIDYGKLINYVGIVRGASQRVVKLETNGRPDDELIEYVDEILDELTTGKGKFGLVAADSAQYRADLEQLKVQWVSVKDEINGVRNGDGDGALLDSSEKLFEIANQTVFSIEEYSAETAKRVSGLIFITALVCGVAFASATYYSIRKYFELKHANEILEDMNARDDLTGAYNMDKFYSEVNRILEQRGDKKFAVLYIDFENFKYVNDVYGYDYGDVLLKNYARLLMNGLGADEVLGRNMADRFVLLRCYEEKEELLEKQKNADGEFLDSTAAMSNRHLMTVACGICCVEDLVETPEARMMVNRANFAQKVVKNKPGNNYAFYDDGIRKSMIAEMSIKDRMQEGLDNEEFLVYMQPKVGAADGRVRGAEALVRWEVPGQGLLSPGLFIPVLEKNHFIGEVDRYVFERVCRWLHERLESGLEVVPISVNVSKIQFYNPDFIPVYAGIKRKYQIPDWLLEIELTESAAFERQDYLMEVVKELHDNGFLCSLDDFGSGYSSLGMLKDLAIDVLKLDGIFFRVSVNVKREHTIVKSIINMVRELNICTVAEGVELEEQVDFLKETGCDLIQGFIFYKPMPVKAFEEVLDGKCLKDEETALKAASVTETEKQRKRENTNTNYVKNMVNILDN